MSRLAELLVGIDLGTTVLKAAAFDHKTGRVLAVAERRLPVRSAADGTREQDLGDVDRAVDFVMGQLRVKLGKKWGAVAGVGLAAQGGSFIICDRETGRALTPMRLWSDQRPSALMSKVTALRPQSYWQALGEIDGPGWGLARMVWLRERSPRLFQPRNIYVGAGEYAFFKLTGQWRQDAGNALQTGCYRVRERRLDGDPLALVDVPLSFVAPLREGHATLPLSATAAVRWRLPAGVPVAGPYFDHEAGYLSAVGVSERPLQCSLGTAWVGNFTVPEETRARSGILLVVPAPQTDGWLVVQPLLTGNVTWDWALATFLGGSHKSALVRAAEVFRKELLPPPGMVALPWMHRMNPLKRDAVGAGGFFGGGVAAKREDFLRATALSMAYEMARVFQQARDERRVDALVLGGGASKGACFRAYLSALFAPLPVYVTAEDLAGLRGSVFAFGGRAATSQAVRVKPPRSRDADRIRAGYGVYAELFERVLGREGNTPLSF